MQKNSFTQGSILPSLLRFTIPVLFALILQTMYGAVDLLVIGRFCTAADVSAVATGSQIMSMVTVVITGLSMGVTVQLGQKIGQGDLDGAGRAAGSAVCLFAAGGLGLMALLIPLAPACAALMRAPEAAKDAVISYVRICGGGLLCIVAYNILGSVFRGIGDSKTPLFAVAVACVTNIVLDLLFVAVFHWDVMGVALATVLAQLLSVVLSLLLIRKKGLPFAFRPSMIRFHRQTILRTLQLGAPVALQDVLVSLSFMVITSIVNGLGVVASAGVGVAEKLCGFILLFPSAFSQSTSAFVAQNIGAGQPERAKRAMFYGIATSFSVGLVLGYLGFFQGEMLASLFSRDPEVNAAAALYLRSYAIDTLLTSFMFCLTGYFSGCGRTTFVMAQGITGAFGVRIPLAFLFSRLTTNLFVIGLATPSSTFVQILLCLWYFRKTERKAV